MEFLVFRSGFFKWHRAATPVFIGSPRAASVGRRFMGVSGQCSSAVGWGFRSLAQGSAGASCFKAWAVAQCCHAWVLVQRRSFRRSALRGLAALRVLPWAFFAVSPSAAIITTEKTAPHSNSRANPALNLVRFALWALRDKAAQRRLALR